MWIILGVGSEYTLGLRYRRPAFIDGGATPSITGRAYRSDAIYESIPHACAGKRDGEYVPWRGVASPRGGSVARRSYFEELETGWFNWVVDSVMGPSREGIPTHGFDGGGGGCHSRNVSGNSQAPLLPPGVTSSPTSPSLTLVNLSGPHTATPTRSSPLKDVRAGAQAARTMSLMRRINWRELSIGLGGLGAVKLELSSFLVSWFYYYYYHYIIASSRCSAFLLSGSAIYCMDGGHYKSLKRYILYAHTVLLFLILTPSHLVTCSAPAVVPQAFSALHGHSDMVVIMRCRGLHKTCCFPLIVIFILILGTCLPGTRLQIQRWATTEMWIQPAHLTSSFFSQNIDTLSLPIISAASIDTFIPF